MPEAVPGQPAVAVSVPAGRYGRPGDPRRTRRLLAVAFAGFLVVGVGFAGWVALHQARGAVSWTDRGLSAPDDRRATVSIQIELPAGASAVCTVRAMNAAGTEVGRIDVTVGPAGAGPIQLDVPLPTSEQAVAGGVKACVRR